MEKYSQFRDKGTAIAPFLPVPPAPSSIFRSIWTAGVFVFRIPPLLILSVLYFCVLEWLPVGHAIKYCALWSLLGWLGVWWVDLQVDGVKRGTLNTSSDNVPQAGSIVASSFTSPLDPLYLAVIFQPIFTRSYPYTRKVERITLFRAIRVAFSAPALFPPPDATLYTLQDLSAQNPSKIIAVFPETTTTNGRGILPLSSSLLSASPKTKIYAVSLRYTPQDITTPVPGGYLTWFWRLLHKPSHQMRVRIAKQISNAAALDTSPHKAVASGYDTNIFDQPAFKENGSSDGWGDMKVDVDSGGAGADGDGEVSKAEQGTLDRVGEDLARLGRVKRVGLGVEDKIEFLRVWGARKR